MQSGKPIKKFPKAPEQNLIVPEKSLSVETPKPGKRSANAGGPSESKLIAKSAPKPVAQPSAATSDKAAPKTTHHRATKHTAAKPAVDAQVSEPIESQGAIEPALFAMAAAVGVSEGIHPQAPREITHREIAELAYSYYIARGYQSGNQQEDWLRAERELRLRR